MPSTPQAQFVHDGDSIDHTPGSDTAAGEVVQVGPKLLGIAKLDIPAGTLGALAVTGVFDVVKQTGVASTIPAGSQVNWNVVTRLAATATGPDWIALGKSVATAGDNDATVRVRLSQ